MNENTLILGENQYYSLDTRRTFLNNNVLVVGTSGSGKTRSIVIPNLLQATGSYVVSDPKGNLYKKYRGYLRERGYAVRKLDFTDPGHSVRYNFFRYIRSTQDIVKVAHMLVHQEKETEKQDPFWDDAGQLLLQAVMAFQKESCRREDQTFHQMMHLVEEAQETGSMETESSVLDRIFEDWERQSPDSYACHTYRKYRVAADRTLRSVLITVNAKLGLYDTPEIRKMTDGDEVNITGIGRRKTALFVVVSDTDRSLDGLVNIFFTQAMNELCRYADSECKENRLPVPVRFILDDFATNCRIAEFPRMIASIRSREISAMLMIQAESQLTECYGHDGRTVIGNCDSYVYLGGNDVETAKAVAERCDLPVRKILNMPVGTNWIFRRGQEPVNGKNYDPEILLTEKGIRRAEGKGR